MYDGYICYYIQLHDIFYFILVLISIILNLEKEYDIILYIIEVSYLLQCSYICYSYRLQLYDIEKIIKGSEIDNVIQYSNNILAL